MYIFKKDISLIFLDMTQNSPSFSWSANQNNTVSVTTTTPLPLAKCVRSPSSCAQVRNVRRNPAGMKDPSTWTPRSVFISL